MIERPSLEKPISILCFCSTARVNSSRLIWLDRQSYRSGHVDRVSVEQLIGCGQPPGRGRERSQVLRRRTALSLRPRVVQ